MSTICDLPRLKEPQQRAVTQMMLLLAEGRNVVLQSPTGSGKTRMAIELLRELRGSGGGIFYVNRKSLVAQARAAFEDAGLEHGVRAADHEDGYEPDEDIQIASADTERVRVFGDKACWNQHKCSLVIVDESHIQKGKTMQHILEDHQGRGAQIVLLSATPVGLWHMLDNAQLLVSGTIAEYRDCGLLVPAKVKSIQQPDMRKVKRSPTGEFVLNGTLKKIYTQTIVGSVIDRWKRYNPDARPTMLYAPGKPESVWFTKQFENIGVRWCHVDANEAYFDGKRRRLTRELWRELLQMYREGTFAGISSRFKLREGVDVPSTYHIILATPIGSIASYLQTVGRGLRAAPGKDHCLITDHGGNYLRHGSPNEERDWELLYRLSNNVASQTKHNAIRNGEAKEPIRCPECEMERLRGYKCPGCGHEHQKSQREVIMANGTMVTMDGKLVKAKRTHRKYNTQTLWNQMYFGFKRKRVKRTFNQLEAFFCNEHGYWPPRNLKNMPRHSGAWYDYVYTVQKGDLQ